MTTKHAASRPGSNSPVHEMTSKKVVSSENSNHTAVSVSSILRYRAEQQFESVKAGHGPLQPGVSPSDVNSNTPKVRVNAANSLRHKSSRTHIRSEHDSETSATGAPRTLRARASTATLRTTRTESSSLVARSPNVINPRQESHATTILAGKSTERLNQLTAQATKQKAIAASPIMTAMLRTQMKQKRIGDQPSVGFRQKKPIDPVIISGSGMRVKAGTPTKLSAQPSEHITPVTPNAIKKMPNHLPIVKNPNRAQETLSTVTRKHASAFS